MTDDHAGEELRGVVSIQPPVEGPGLYVSRGGGRWAPRTFQATYDDPDRPFRLGLEIVVTADGEAVVYQFGAIMRVDSPDIGPDGRLIDLHSLSSDRFGRLTGDSLRLPFKSIVDSALQVVERRGDVAPPGTRSHAGQRFSDPDRFLVGGVLRPVVEPVERSARRSRRVLTPALLTEVAAVVREARTAGVSARRAVAEHFRIAPNTARNWISRAKRDGYLDEEGKG